MVFSPIFRTFLGFFQQEYKYKIKMHRRRSYRDFLRDETVQIPMTTKRSRRLVEQQSHEQV